MALLVFGQFARLFTSTRIARRRATSGMVAGFTQRISGSTTSRRFGALRQGYWIRGSTSSGRLIAFSTVIISLGRCHRVRRSSASWRLVFGCGSGGRLRLILWFSRSPTAPKGSTATVLRGWTRRSPTRCCCRSLTPSSACRHGGIVTGTTSGWSLLSLEWLGTRRENLLLGLTTSGCCAFGCWLD